MEDAGSRFLAALDGITDPELKRHAIGTEQFVEVQQRILESEHFFDGRWILGQGIYPDADRIRQRHGELEVRSRLITIAWPVSRN